MKALSLASVALTLLLGFSRSAAADDPAVVKEAINDVHHGPSVSAIDTQPAQEGTKIHDGEFVGTGGQSRAELLLPSRSVTRLGQYTIFNYSVASNTVDLQAGTVLFCKPKDARELQIKNSAVTAGITGTTGFTSAKVDSETGQKTYRFGIIEGEGPTDVIIKGETYPVHPGEELIYLPPNPPQVTPFDVPKMVKTSVLLTGFKRPLPNQAYIDEEIASYNDAVSRGFIQPTNGSQTNTNNAGNPTGPATAYDSAQNARTPQTPPGPQTQQSGQGPANPNRVGPPLNSSYH